jgi:ABC-type amino acid transport substrate-binding protein
VSRGEKGEQLNKKISKAITEMTASGELEKRTDAWSRHDDWQPCLEKR